MKPSNIELCSVAYHAGRIGEDANAAYWLECNSIEASHLRRKIREKLDAIADLFGLKVVEMNDDAVQEDAA